MENWLVYGIITSFCFGLTILLYKIGINKGQGINPYTAGLIYSIGIFLFFLLLFFIKKPEIDFNNFNGITIVLVAGIIWAIGNLFVVLAFSNNADIARLAPIVSTSTLFAVFFGITFLKEIPTGIAMFKVVSGAVLIVLGAVLVSS